MIKLLALAGLLVVTLAGVGCTRSDEPGLSVTSAGRNTPSSLPSPGSTLEPAPSNWQVFTSVAGGYRLRYPPSWRAKESTGSGGPVLSLLSPSGMGISVLVTSTAPPNPGASNSSTTRCKPVRVGGLKGSWCEDITSMVVTTTLQGRDRWYVLTTSLQQPAAPAGTYDRVLASFRLS